MLLWRAQVAIVRAYRRAIQLEERRLLPGRGAVAVGGAVEVSSRRLLPERALVVQVNHESCGGARGGVSGGSAGWVVVRGMQVRMRALLQVVVAWACGGDGASARTAAEALGGHGSPG